jgi:hypothetical protein
LADEIDLEFLYLSSVAELLPVGAELAGAAGVLLYEYDWDPEPALYIHIPV